jgi:hypothetical protein
MCRHLRRAHLGSSAELAKSVLPSARTTTSSENKVTPTVSPGG